MLKPVLIITYKVYGINMFCITHHLQPTVQVVTINIWCVVLEVHMEVDSSRSESKGLALEMDYLRRSVSFLVRVEPHSK